MLRVRDDAELYVTGSALTEPAFGYSPRRATGQPTVT
jgi:hypothetical protein